MRKQLSSHGKALSDEGVIDLVNDLVARNAERIERYGSRCARGDSFEERRDQGLELIHMVWIAACESLARWPADKPLPADLDAWLSGIARHLVLQYYRRYYRDHKPEY